MFKTYYSSARAWDSADTKVGQFSPKLELPSALLCYAYPFPLLSPLAFCWCCDFAACEGPSPVGCQDLHSLEWAVVLSGLQSRNVAFAWFLRSHARMTFSCLFFLGHLCLAKGTNSAVNWGAFGYIPCPHHAVSAAATLASNLILISSLWCFWQSKFPTQAWEFNISTFAWLIGFVSLLWRHCFYGKLMDSHVVFLMAETTSLPTLPSLSIQRESL